VRARHSVAFDIRMGLNSGDVMIGRISDDLSMDYTAFDDFTAFGHDVGLHNGIAGRARPHLSVGTHRATG
jgi:class 3 adenylate cyclase